jgi:hypothetical protein
MMQQPAVDGTGRAVPAPATGSSVGLAPELVREMRNSADGYDATLQYMRGGAQDNIAEICAADGCERG